MLVVFLTTLSLFVVAPAEAQTPLVQWAQTAYSVTETDADQSLDLTININPVIPGNNNRGVSVTVLGTSTATQGTDWSFPANCNTLPPGVSTTTCTLTIKGDDVSEASETIKLRLNDASPAYELGSNTVTTVTIIDDEPPAYTLSVDATPPCNSEVTDTSVGPTYVLELMPAPDMNVPTERRVVPDYAEPRWLSALPIVAGAGRSIRSTSNSFPHLRNAYAGFRGFEFRLTDTPSVTAQCFWTFSEQTPDTRTPTTDDTTTDTPTTNTGGTGTGGGGGGAAPPKDTPSPEEPSDTRCGESDREYLISFYEATGGENWLEKEYWNSEEPLDQWFGVKTDEDGEVISLRLEENNLSGEMPTEELLCLNENTELKELALWDNDDLSGEVPEDLALAVERAALRYIAEMLNLNPEWFEDYEDPFNFEDWYERVTTDDDGRVVELELPGEIPESIISQFKKRREIVITTNDGGCALSPEGSSAFGLFLLTLFVFAALGRKRAR